MSTDPSPAQGYYADRLSSERLRRVYEGASPRVRQYLEAEIAFAAQHIRPNHTVVELGCGYGRVLAALARRCRRLIGIDTSLPSLVLAARELADCAGLRLVAANAVSLPFGSGSCDVVLCLQNGLSAFAESQSALLREAVRITRSGGIALFSSYAAGFWEHRLAWFQAQAKAGLIGEIDTARTINGAIVCHDGFRATTVSPERFRELTTSLDVHATIEEVDGSSLFCRIVPR